MKSQIPNLKSQISHCLLLAAALCFGFASTAQAQWVTQSFALKGGWNAVYLHVDASHDTLNNLIANDLSNPIQEVWLWAAPASVQQFVQSPQTPLATASQWVSWARTNSTLAALQRLGGNMACLVRVHSATNNYTWNLKGKPVPPQYQWTTTGLNFLGFPTPSTNPPSFEDFLAKAPGLAQTSEIYQYPGGELGATNPVRVFTLRTTFVRRGEAVWMRTGATFNRYFGPFDVELQSASGVNFGDSIGQYRVRLRNTTSGQVTVTLSQVASETPPAGQTAIVQTPPLLVRGALNLTNLTYGFTNLSAGPKPARREGGGFGAWRRPGWCPDQFHRRFAAKGDCLCRRYAGSYGAGTAAPPRRNPS